MAYATSNPPRLVSQPIAGLRLWQYSSADAVTLVRVSGYFTDGWDLGMRAGDLVHVLDNDASPITGSLCWVTSATSTAVDLSDGVTITGTDTD
jgi:hypothetical protein